MYWDKKNTRYSEDDFISRNICHISDLDLHQGF